MPFGSGVDNVRLFSQPFHALCASTR